MLCITERKDESLLSEKITNNFRRRMTTGMICRLDLRGGIPKASRNHFE
jgi:hypothetical protein